MSAKGGGGATYLPVFAAPEEGSGAPATPSGDGPASKERDPLYAALLGTNIGSAIGGAERETELNTLDEPVSETLGRDLRMVADKAWMVLVLSDPESSVRDWDLWGPLINSLLLAMLLGMRSAASVTTFTLTFTLIWLGAAITTSNAKLLGYRLSLLPTISFVGYCLSPLTGGALLWTFSPSFWPVKGFLVAGGMVWALTAALRLMDIDPALEDRRILASFPFVLYFILLAWMMLLS